MCPEAQPMGEEKEGRVQRPGCFLGYAGGVSQSPSLGGGGWYIHTEPLLSAAADAAHGEARCPRSGWSSWQRCRAVPRQASCPLSAISWFNRREHTAYMERWNVLMG